MTGAILLLFLIAGCFYLLPTIIAVLRKHKDAPAIAAINILLGWSLIGWFMSFIWSLADPSGRRGGTQTVVINTAQHNIAAPVPQPAPPPPPQPQAMTAPVYAAPAPALAVTSSAPGGHTALEAGDRDTAFWDGGDKSHPDHLEEYLIRFPNGRFVQLARSRLERQGIAPPPLPAAEPAPQPPAAPPASAPGPVACSSCGVALERDSRFCADCGAAVPG